MIDTNELRMLMQDFKLAGSPMFVQTAQMGELLDRLEAAEKERDWHAESGTWAAAWIAAKQHGAKPCCVCLML